MTDLTDMMSWDPIGSHLTKKSPNGQATLSPCALVQDSVRCDGHHGGHLAMWHARELLCKGEREFLCVGGRGKRCFPKCEQHCLQV